MQAEMCFDATTEGETGRLLATCPSLHSWSVIPTLTDWGYRPASLAQRRHGTRSYSTTSPSRSCSDSTTQPRNTQPSMQAQALQGGVVSIYGVVVILSRGARRVR